MVQGGAIRASPQRCGLRPLMGTSVLLPDPPCKRVGWDVRYAAKAVHPNSLRGNVGYQSGQTRARPQQPLFMLPHNTACNIVCHNVARCCQKSVVTAQIQKRRRFEPAEHRVSVAHCPGNRPQSSNASFAVCFRRALHTCPLKWICLWSRPRTALPQQLGGMVHGGGSKGRSRRARDQTSSVSLIASLCYQV